MLRSIFSLIQNIIDSDKEYNNKKSSTVIYLVSNPTDNKINMDLEIDGKNRQAIKFVEENEKPDSSKYFTITTEQGDTVTCKHASEKNIKSKIKSSKQKKAVTEVANERAIEDDVGDKPSFSCVNEEPTNKEKSESKYDELQGDVGMNVKELLASLPQKKTSVSTKDRDQLSALLEQIQKMKTGMERLHQIAQQFTCSEKFKQDVDFLMKHLSLKKTTDTADSIKLSPSKP